jgi:hypothetical protein
LIAIFHNVSANGKDIVSERFHLLVDFLSQYHLSEQADEVVGHHHKVQGGL